MSRRLPAIRVLMKGTRDGVKRVKIGSKIVSIKTKLSNADLVKLILTQFKSIIRMLTIGGQIKKKLNEGYKPETTAEIIKLSQDKNLLLGKQREIMADAQKLREAKGIADTKLTKTLEQLSKLEQQEKEARQKLLIIEQEKQQAVKRFEEQKRITDISIGELQREKIRADKLIELERRRNEGLQLRENIDEAMRNKSNNYKTAVKLFLWARIGNFKLPNSVGANFGENNDEQALAFILNTDEGAQLLNIANKYKLRQYADKDTLFNDIAPLLSQYGINVRDIKKSVKNGGVLPFSYIDRQSENLSPNYIIDKLSEEQKKDIDDLLMKLREIENNRDAIDDIVADAPAAQPDALEPVVGTGRDDGLLDGELNQLLKNQKGYLGTIAVDEIDKLKMKPGIDQAFIINTETRQNGGEHWQAWFISPVKSQSVEFYDSYGDNPDGQMLADVMRNIKNKIKPNGILKLKINKIKAQDDSNNCGWFSMRFLVNRFKGQDFKNASGFKGGEMGIERFKNYYMSKNGELMGEGKILDKLKEFGQKVKEKFKESLAKTKEKTKELGQKIKSGISEGLRRIKEAFTGPQSLPPYIIKILEDTQDDPIVYADVSRFPVNQKVINFLDGITSGKLKSRTAEMNYDNLFHLMLNVKLQSGKVFLIDKRPKISVRQFPSLKSQQMLEKDKSLGGAMMDVPVKNADVNLIKLFNDGLKNAGSVEKFYQYNLSTNNCQHFIMFLLNAQGWANEEIKKFVQQDIASIFQKDIAPQKKFANFLVKIKTFFDTLGGQGHEEQLMSVLIDKHLGKREVRKALDALDVVPYRMVRKGEYNEFKINKKKYGQEYEPEIIGNGYIILIKNKI